MNIAMIGPGQISIPPNGWGGTEAFMWNHIKELRSRNILVDIFNTRDLESVANDINSRDYDFVHLHYDAYCDFFNQKLKKPFCCTSHWGEVKEWNDIHMNWWMPIFRSMCEVKGLISLSHEISEVYRQKGYKGFLRNISVGTTVNNFTFQSKGNGKAICLGKLEPRKMQAELAFVSNNSCNIDFYGPNQDARFRDNATCKWCGVANRDWLYQNLTNYSCLILLSKGEAAAQVIPEALSSGLSVVVTETAAANLDRDKKFIKVIPNNWFEQNVDVARVINGSIEENEKYRADIRKYAKEVFDTKVIIDNYLEIIKEFNGK